MMANKFYIKRKKERKKKNSFSSASDRFSRKTRTKNTSAFFFQRSRVVFKVTVRDPETPLISKIFNHRRRGTKTRLVLGSGQPRQRVMKTFPSFFLLFPFLLFPFFFPFFFLHRNDNYKRSSCVQRGAAPCHDRNVVSLSLCFFSRLHHECNLSLQTRFHRANNNNYEPPMYRPTMLTGNAHPIKLPRSRRTPTTWMAVSPSPKTVNASYKRIG